MAKEGMTYYRALIVGALVIYVQFATVQAAQSDDESCILIPSEEPIPEHQSEWSSARKVMVGVGAALCLTGVVLALTFIFKRKQLDEGPSQPDKDGSKVKASEGGQQQTQPLTSQQHASENVLAAKVQAHDGTHASGALNQKGINAEGRRRLRAEAAERRLGKVGNRT